jgi:hypothetical protein
MYCQCPVCGRHHHLRPAPEYPDLAAWIAKVAPGTKPGETPRVHCLRCWKTARASDDPKSN